VEKCTTQCRLLGYLYAGLQDASQCFCGNSYGNQGHTRVSDSTCTFACAGNSAEICGGSWLNSIYAVGSATGTTVAATVSTTGTGRKRQATVPFDVNAFATAVSDISNQPVSRFVFRPLDPPTTPSSQLVEFLVAEDQALYPSSSSESVAQQLISTPTTVWQSNGFVVDSMAIVAPAAAGLSAGAIAAIAAARAILLAAAAGVVAVVAWKLHAAKKQKPDDYLLELHTATIPSNPSWTPPESSPQLSTTAVQSVIKEPEFPVAADPQLPDKPRGIRNTYYRWTPWRTG